MGNFPQFKFDQILEDCPDLKQNVVPQFIEEIFCLFDYESIELIIIF